MQGYFRDDGPLCELILDDSEQRELDALWHELDFVTLAPMRQYKDFIFFERAEPPRFMCEAEFDFARSEDKDAPRGEDEAAGRGRIWPRRARSGASDEALEAIETYFADISAEIRRVEKARLAAEPSHLEALAKFAERAYRRPLSQPPSATICWLLPHAARQGRAGPRGRDARHARQRADVAALLLPLRSAPSRATACSRCRTTRWPAG